MLSAGLAEAVALDGLIWLVLAAFLAGLIRPKSGPGRLDPNSAVSERVPR